jgi:hypothetical protein
MLVTTPLVLLLLDYWPLRRLENEKAKIKNLLRKKTPFFLLSLFAGGITYFAQRSSGAVVPFKAEGLWMRVGNALAGCLGYLEKFFWPQHLTILYLRTGSLSAGLVASSLVGLLGVSVFAGWMARRRPYLVVGWLWFLLMLLPVSGLVQVGPQFMADRYTYLPGIGLAIVVAWGANEIAGALGAERTRQLLLAMIAVAVLCGCIMLSRHQLGYWRNTETLMGHAVQLDPNNYVAHNNLGAYYSRLGRTDEAREHYQRVRELDGAK